MSAYDDAVAADGAVGYWKLDEAAFPLVDSVGGHNIAGISGTGPYALGVSTGDAWLACSLQGGPWLNTGFAFSGATALTYECWALTTAGTANIAGCRNDPALGVIFAFGSGYLNSGPGTPYVGYDGPNIAVSRRGSNAYNNGGWHHLACTWQGTPPAGTVTSSQFAFYADGQRVDTSAVSLGSPNAPLNSGNLLFGASNNYGSVSGSTLMLSRFAVYTTALSAVTLANHSALGWNERRAMSGTWGWVG